MSYIGQYPIVAVGPPPKAPTYQDGRWLCDQNVKPIPTSNQQAYCCPSGWVISTYNDPAPCLKEQDLFDCGPFPPGYSRANGICCNRAKQWFPKNTDGSDPCAVFNRKPSDILSIDITDTTLKKQRKVITPTVLLITSIGLSLMFLLTLIVRD